MKKEQIKNRITILSTFSILLLLTCLAIAVYEFFNSAPKTDDLNYGFMALIIISVISFIGIGIDYILYKSIKNKWVLNFIGLTIAMLFIYLWYN